MRALLFGVDAPFVLSAIRVLRDPFYTPMIGFFDNPALTAPHFDAVYTPEVRHAWVVAVRLAAVGVVFGLVFVLAAVVNGAVKWVGPRYLPAFEVVRGGPAARTERLVNFVCLRRAQPLI